MTSNVSHEGLRFVAIKSCEQQGVMSLHRVREGLMEERTGCINQIRGAQFGSWLGIVPRQNSS